MSSSTKASAFRRCRETLDRLRIPVLSAPHRRGSNLLSALLFSLIWAYENARLANSQTMFLTWIAHYGDELLTYPAHL